MQGNLHKVTATVEEEEGHPERLVDMTSEALHSCPSSLSLVCSLRQITYILWASIPFPTNQLMHHFVR